MNAVFKKEFRDLSRWIPLGMVASVVMLWLELPGNVHEATSATERLAPFTMMVAGAIAIILGLLQSVFDARSDARGYLLHRPVSATSVYWSKIAAGFAAYWIAMAPGLLVTVVYLASKGPEQLPTSASQVLPLLWVVLALFSLHPTMIWIIHRDAWWMGTKLLPAVGVVSGLALLLLMLDGIPLSGVLLTLACLFLIGTFLLAVTLLAAKHAFADEARLLSQGADRWRSRASGIELTLSAVVLFGLMVAVVMGIESVALPRPNRDYTIYNVTMNQDGEFFETSRTTHNYGWDDAIEKMRPVGTDKDFVEVDRRWMEANQAVMAESNDTSRRHPLRLFTQLGSMESSRVPLGDSTLVNHAGRILVYGGDRGLHAVVTPEGTFDSLEQATGRFERPGFAGPWHSSAGGTYRYTTETNPLIGDDQAVYQLNSDDLSVTRLLDQRVDAMGLLFSEPGQPASLWTRLDDRLTEHHLVVLDEEKELPKWRDGMIGNRRGFSLPRIKIVGSRDFILEPTEGPATVSVLRTSDGQLALTQATRDGGAKFKVGYKFLTGDASDAKSRSVTLPLPHTQNSDEKYIAWMIPPGLMLTVLAGMVAYTSSMPPVGWMFFAIPMHSFMAAAMAFWLGRRFELPAPRRWAWAIGSAVLGLGGALAMLAIYRKPIRESCSHCHQLSRVDRDKCQNCGQIWEAPPSEGIEILDSGQPIGADQDLAAAT